MAEILPEIHATKYSGTVMTPNPEKFEYYILNIDSVDPKFSTAVRPEILKAINDYESDPDTLSLFL
jgi:hypothetical protein